VGKGEKSMNCRKVKKLLINYSGSLLRKPLSETNGLKEGKKLTELESHLSACSECHHKIVSLEHTERLLFAIPRKEPLDGLWDSLRARIVAEESPSEFGFLSVSFDQTFLFKRKVCIPKSEFRIPHSFAALAAFAIVLIFAGFFFIRPFFSQENINPDELSLIYVEQHALRAWRDPLADKAWLGWSAQFTAEDPLRRGLPQEMKLKNQ
jgi:hypothetical protein